MFTKRKTFFLLFALFAATFIVLAYWFFIIKKPVQLQQKKGDEPRLEQGIPLPSNEPATVPLPPVYATTSSEIKLYRNEKWGFVFEYPNDWIVKENTFGSHYSKFNLVVNPGLVRSSNFTISLNIVLPEFPDRSFENIEKITTSVVVAGVPGIKYQYEFEGSQETAIIVPLRDYKLILGMDNKQYEDEFASFLASFKFTGIQ
ncbi:MAG: hypothetical protein WCT49_01035 [Candidatus Paceibacterota bacterium]|jgi:hypothetical protein|nr:hypothetical protein [Candidatus Paceibacterota bacterium]